MKNKMTVSAEQRKEAIAGTKKKTALAKQLEAQLSKWNNKLLKVFKTKYPVNQLPTLLIEDLEDILMKHYFKTAEEFSLVDLKKGIAKQAEQEIDRVETDIAKKVIVFIEKDSVLNISSITKTTEDILNETIKKAQQIAAEMAIEEGEPLDNAAIALIATRLLKKRLNGRLPVIGITETNWPSEGTKAIHVKETIQPLTEALNTEREFIGLGNNDIASESAAVALGVSAFSYSKTARKAGKAALGALALQPDTAIRAITKLIKKVVEILKTWVTMGDNRVRRTHQTANGQTVLENEPFVVAGELLMYPSDRSLGASTDNIIG